jgi:uncharacterized protein (DUF433 family)/DNA-binding transcriptional MerR regulator
MKKDRREETVPIGVGYYNVPEAARLLRASARNINRWLGGYDYATKAGEKATSAPLWTPDLPGENGHIELSFRDLIELRFVIEFQRAGLGLKTIRKCLELAKECARDDRPFSTNMFQTDGHTIFLDRIRQSGESELLDLKNRQYGFKQIFAKSFKDLDFAGDMVSRWRPFNGKASIVIDPKRAFGQPIATDFGVPTIALAEAVKAEGSVDRVAQLFELPSRIVRDAVAFEESLLKAA